MINLITKTQVGETFLTIGSNYFYGCLLIKAFLAKLKSAENVQYVKNPTRPKLLFLNARKCSFHYCRTDLQLTLKLTASLCRLTELLDAEVLPHVYNLRDKMNDFSCRKRH